MPRPKRLGPYKRYLLDVKASVPKSTVWLRRQQLSDALCTEGTSDKASDSESDLSCNMSLQVEVEDNNSAMSSSSEDEVVDCITAESTEGNHSKIPLCERILSLERKVHILEKELAVCQSITKDIPDLLSKMEALHCCHPISCTNQFQQSPFLKHSQVSKDGPEHYSLGHRPDEEMIRFGCKMLKASQVSGLCHKKETILAAELCSMLFTPEEMALCSMKGKMNNKSKNSFRKLPIDETRVRSIIDYICRTKGLSGPNSEKNIRIAIANKLRNFCKTTDGKKIIMHHQLHSLSGKRPE